MANRRHKSEEIVTKFRQVELLIGQPSRRANHDRARAVPLRGIRRKGLATYPHAHSLRQGFRHRPVGREFRARLGRAPGNRNPSRTRRQRLFDRAGPCWTLSPGIRTRNPGHPRTPHQSDIFGMKSPPEEWWRWRPVTSAVGPGCVETLAVLPV